VAGADSGAAQYIEGHALNRILAKPVCAGLVEAPSFFPGAKRKNGPSTSSGQTALFKSCHAKPALLSAITIPLFAIAVPRAATHAAPHKREGRKGKFCSDKQGLAS
jgi:hypothetical protein